MNWWVEGWPLGWLAKYQWNKGICIQLFITDCIDGDTHSQWPVHQTPPRCSIVFFAIFCKSYQILLHKIAAETWNAFNYTYNYLGGPLSSDSSVKKIHAAHFTEQICFVYGVYGTNCAIKAVWETLSSHLGSPALWPVLLPAPGLLITSPWPGSFTPPK